MACCKCCCGNQDCTEGQEGKCCCGGASGTCCQTGEYCCSGACQSSPCSCTGDYNQGTWSPECTETQCCGESACTDGFWGLDVVGCRCSGGDPDPECVVDADNADVGSDTSKTYVFSTRTKCCDYTAWAEYPSPYLCEDLPP